MWLSSDCQLLCTPLRLCTDHPSRCNVSCPCRQRGIWDEETQTPALRLDKLEKVLVSMQFAEEIILCHSMGCFSKFFYPKCAFRSALFTLYWSGPWKKWQDFCKHLSFQETAFQTMERHHPTPFPESQPSDPPSPMFACSSSHTPFFSRLLVLDKWCDL